MKTTSHNTAIPLDFNYFNPKVEIAKRRLFAPRLLSQLPKFVSITVEKTDLSEIVKQPKSIHWIHDGVEYIREIKGVEFSDDDFRKLDFVREEVIHSVCKLNDIRLAEPITMNSALFEQSDDLSIAIELRSEDIINSLLKLKSNLIIPLDHYRNLWLVVANQKIENYLLDTALSEYSFSCSLLSTLYAMAQSIRLKRQVSYLKVFLANQKLINIQSGENGKYNLERCAALYFTMVPEISNVRDPVAWALAEYICVNDTIPSRQRVTDLILNILDIYTPENLYRTVSGKQIKIESVAEEKKRVFKVLMSNLLVAIVNNNSVNEQSD